jgi:hypothetical protein
MTWEGVASAIAPQMKTNRVLLPEFLVFLPRLSKTRLIVIEELVCHTHFQLRS